MSRTWFQLDEIAWNDLVDVMADVLDKAFELHAESAARLGRGADHENARRVAMGLLLFERAETAAPAAEAGERARPTRPDAPSHVSSARLCSS